MEVIHPIKWLIEHHRDNKKDLPLVFINSENSYDKLPREVFMEMLEEEGCSRLH